MMEMGEFISVKDRLPSLKEINYYGKAFMESEPVVAICDGKCFIAKILLSHVQHFDIIDQICEWVTVHDIFKSEFKSEKVTYWMPIPELPESEEKK